MQQYAIGDILMRVPNKRIFQTLLQKMTEYKPQLTTEFDDVIVDDEFRADEEQRKRNTLIFQVIKNHEHQRRAVLQQGGIGMFGQGMQMPGYAFKQIPLPGFR